MDYGVLYVDLNTGDCLEELMTRHWLDTYNNDEKYQVLSYWQFLIKN